MPSQQQLLEIISIQTDIAKRGLDLGGVMQLVVERTLPLIGADGAVIELAEGDDMVYRAAAGIANPHLGLRLPRGTSLSGQCVAAGKILRCNDSETDPRVNREACRAVGLRSMMVMPLRHLNTTVGVLKAMSGQVNKFQARDEKLLGLLSELIGAAMFHATQLNLDELFYKATHDSLTELANRSLFMDRLRNMVASAGREHSPAALLMLDMDGLKQLNDRHGHRAGDAALKEFGRRIKAISRQTDTVARLGGDEFAIILLPVDPGSGVQSVIARLESQITQPFEFEGTNYPLNASIGAANFPEDSQDFEKLLEIADQRMYAVKRAHHQQAAATTH